MPRVLVIGGTGTVGREVVAQLEAAGVPVRALARRSAPVCADLTVPETLEAALDGVDAVFLVWTAPGDTAEAVVARIARRARRIVYLSAPIETPHPLFQQPNPGRDLTARIERLIEASGMEWTFVRPGMFAANALDWWAPQTRAGDLVRWPYLDAPTAPVDERDIAAVATRALCEDALVGARPVLTGPESLTQAEQIAIIGRVIGRRLRMEETPREEARLPAMLLNAWAAARGRPAHVTDTVAEVTGRAPRTFGEWTRDHADAFL